MLFQLNELSESAEKIHLLSLATHEYCKNQENCQVTSYEAIQLKIKRMGQALAKLHVILHKRNKRGLLNIIGSVSKSLFGTLNENDLTLVNQNIDKLFDSQNKLTHIVQNQTAMIKSLLQDEHFNDLSKRL